MKIKCLYNAIRSVPDSQAQKRLEKYIHYTDGCVQGLVVGMVYNVYGYVLRDNVPWYFLCKCRHDDYPVPESSDFFEVVDERVSKYWQDVRNRQKLVVFEEWSQDVMFYENLLDGGKDELELFAKYRKLMDLEFEENAIISLGIQADVCIEIDERYNSQQYISYLTKLFGEIQKGWGLSNSFWSHNPNPSEFIKCLTLNCLVLVFDSVFDFNVYRFENPEDLTKLLETGFPEVSFFLTDESEDFLMYYEFQNKFFFARGSLPASLFSGET